MADQNFNNEMISPEFKLGENRMGEVIPVGTYVRFAEMEDREQYGDGVVWRSSHGSVNLRCEGKGFLGISALADEVVPLSGKPHAMFPLREHLPYGQYYLVDGTRVLYNRDYQPLAAFSSSGERIHCDPDQRLRLVAQDWFYGDGWGGSGFKPFNCGETFHRTFRALHGLETEGREWQAKRTSIPRERLTRWEDLTSVSLEYAMSRRGLYPSQSHAAPNNNL